MRIQVLSCIAFLLWALNAFSQDAMRVYEGFEGKLITPYLLRDPGHRLSLDSVISEPYEQQFKLASNEHLSFGFDKARWWLHFQVNNSSAKTTTYLLRLNRKNFDSFKIYQRKNNASTALIGVVGDEYVSDKFFLINGYYIVLRIEPGLNDFWAETENNLGSMHLSLSLHSQENYAVYTRETSLVYGALLGTILVTWFFCIILFYYNRDYLYLIYLAYTMAILLREAYNFSAHFSLPAIYLRHCTSFLIAASFAALFRRFMRLNELNPRANRFIKWFSISAFTGAVLVGILVNTNAAWMLNTFFQISSLINLLFILMVVLLSIKYYKRQMQAKVMLVGTLPLAIVFVVVTLRNLDWFPNTPLLQFAVALGFILELLLFTAALSRWYGMVDAELKYLQMEIIMKQKEKLLAVQTAEHRVKERIARDLHDDVAASLSGIRIMSQVAEGQFKNKAPEAVPLLKQIIQIAQSSLESITDIIWALKPHPDYLNDMASRSREYAFKLLENSDLEYQIQIPRTLPAQELDVEARHNIYLIFKEALNNVLKHSQCTNVDIYLDVQGQKLQLIIKDNGIGFNLEHVKKGQGLNNMLARARDIGGKLSMDSAPGQGTTVSFELVLQAN